VHRLVLHRGEFRKAFLRCGVAGELVGADPLRGLARVIEQASEEALRRIGVTMLLHEDVHHLPVLIDGSPQVDLFPADLQEHLIQVPDAAGPPFAPAKLGREVCAELSDPGTDGLIGDDAWVG
jgi:hypothetical protein